MQFDREITEKSLRLGKNGQYFGHRVRSGYHIYCSMTTKSTEENGEKKV